HQAGSRLAEDFPRQCATPTCDQAFPRATRGQNRMRNRLNSKGIEMAKNSDERDGNRSSHWEGDGGVAEKTTDRTGRKTETRARDEDEDKEKGFHVSRKTLIIGGVCAGVVLIGVLLYWLHARNFESTDDSQSDYDGITKLSHEKVFSKQDLDNATAALRTGKGAMDAATSDLVAAEAALHNAELQLSYTTIIAPADGVIGKKTVETGMRIQPGQALMAVVERNVWVLGNFKETQLARMRVGQHVDVKIDAIPDHKFSAHVDSLQPGTGSTFALLPPDNATGNFTKIVQRVPVKIVFDDVGKYRARVVPGLSCEPKIYLRTGRPH